MKTFLSYLMVGGLCLYGSLSMGCSSTQTTTTTPTAAPTMAATTPPPPATTAAPASPAAASPAASPVAGSPGTEPTDAAPSDQGSPGAGDNDAALLAGGTTMTHNEGGLSFTLPKEWKQEQKGNKLVATSLDGNVTIIFVVTDETDVKKVAEEMGTIVDETLDDVEVKTEATTEEINGLTQVWADGTGTYDGEKMDWDVSVVLGAKKPMAVLAVGEIHKNEDLVYAVYRSIQEVK